MFRKEPITYNNADTCGHLARVRRLTLSLAGSVALNIALLGFLLYNLSGGFLLSSQEIPKRLWHTHALPLADERTNRDVLQAFVRLLPEQLVAKMSDARYVEDGFAERDLALGCLVTLHHLDIAKALHGSPLPKQRFLPVEGCPNERVVLFPGLTDAQFAQVMAFINSERWPLTSEGLFLALCQPHLREDASLAETFFLTQEFLTLQRLFARAEASVDRVEILSLLLEGDWATVQAAYQAALQPEESSAAIRRSILLGYINAGSKVAGQLLLKTDGAYAAKRFDDATLLALLKTIDKVTPDAEQFAAELVHSPRSDAVLDCARKLCSTALVAAVKQIEEKNKVYIVQRGDSLWKISRQVKVPIQTLKAHNGLDSDVLQPGATLKIP